MAHAIGAGAFSALTLTRNSSTAPISIQIPISKLNGAPIRSHLELKSAKRKHRGWKITAAQSSSSSISGTMSVGLSQDLANSLAEVEVLDLSGNMVRLTDLWKERKAVVGFARHFGCVLCRKRADILASQEGYFNAAGVALVLIGPGSIEQAKTFFEQTKFPGEVYADPNHSAYDALKFVSGVSTTFTPSAGRKIIELYLDGYRQDWGLSFQKDTVSRGGWQQGGILIAGPGENNIIYLHKVYHLLHCRWIEDLDLDLLHGLLRVASFHQDYILDSSLLELLMKDKEAGDDPDIQYILKACRAS